MATQLTDEPVPADVLPERYEVVNGTVIEAEPMSAYAAEVANRVRDVLADYGRATGLGRPRMDMIFLVPVPADPTRQREPDVAFLTFDRWPADRPVPFRGNPLEVVPDLAVDVSSPNNSGDELFTKAVDYLTAGVRVVWLIFPEARHAVVFEPDTDPRGVRETGTLDGGRAFPDLRVPMAGLFPPVA